MPLVAKPNAGLPRLEGLKTVFDMDAKTFAASAKSWIAAGANPLGGCCGTTPGSHYCGAGRGCRKKEAGSSSPDIARALSSARSFLPLDEDQPLLVVVAKGSIPPARRPQQELMEGKLSIIRQMAQEQEIQGASSLDVNIGVPGIDEVATIKK